MKQTVENLKEYETILSKFLDGQEERFQYLEDFKKDFEDLFVGRPYSRFVAVGFNGALSSIIQVAREDTVVLYNLLDRIRGDIARLQDIDENRSEIVETKDGAVEEN